MFVSADEIMGDAQSRSVALASWPYSTRLARRPLAVLCGAAVATGLLLIGCSAKDAAEEAPTVTVQVAAAENGAIQSVVTADGTLYPRDQAAIVPKVSAPVKKFYVDRGSKVHAGQLLAELENQDLAGALTENQGGYEQAEANYQAAVQSATQNLNLAKQQLDAQQKVYDSREALLKQGAVSAKDVEDARISLTQAQNQYDLAQKQFDLKAAEGQLTAAKGKSANAEAQLSYTKITSPIDGVITDRPVYPGETPPSGSPILTVMDLSRVIARAHVSQQEAAQLNVGDAATISSPGQTEGVPGKVTLVSPALDQNSTTVEIWVEAANPGERLRPGSDVRVAIVAKTVPHAIIIPAVALLTGTDGTSSVILLDSSDKPQPQRVKVGVRNGDDVQITDGVKAGDRVVTAGAFELNSEDPDVLAKTKVQVQAANAPAKGDDK
jgi:multidrug efflux pump subunit AcrA (membrane-fusion protein)